MKMISTLPPASSYREKGVKRGSERDRHQERMLTLLSIHPRAPQLITHLCATQLTVCGLLPWKTGREGEQVKGYWASGHQTVDHNRNQGSGHKGSGTASISNYLCDFGQGILSRSSVKSEVGLSVS